MRDKVGPVLALLVAIGIGVAVTVVGVLVMSLFGEIGLRPVP